jgi:hypothetical protein
MRLITEVKDIEVLTEANDEGKKSYFIEGIFMQGDIPNRNGRRYASTILDKEMQRYQKDFISEKRSLGELGHPDGPTINGDRVSHLITDLRREGSNFYGKAKILGTPMGEIVKTFIDEGVRCGVSTRGLGSVIPAKDGIMEVQDDFHLSTVDIVTDPSAPSAFVNGIMENVEYYYDIASNSWLPLQIQEEAKQVVENIEKEVKKQYNRITRKINIDENTAARLFETFVSSLKK